MTGEIDQILINRTTIENSTSNFLLNSKTNPFYNKNIFFTGGLRGNRFVYFQILGNLGGTANDFDFSIQTDYYVISDSIIEKLILGIKDIQLEELEQKINAKGKKYKHLQIITEEALLKHIMKRCLSINDQVTLNLITSVK
jgi:hypothetical protein